MESPAIKTVRAFVEAINSGDADKLSELMTQRHQFVDSGGLIHEGRENMRKGWREYFRMFPNYKMVIEDVISDGKLVAAFGSASGTYNGNRGLVPENRIEMPAAWRARIENGKVGYWQVYADWTEGARIIEEDQKLN